MKKLGQICTLCLAAILLLSVSGCGGRSGALNDADTDRSGQKGSKALYIYLCGSTLESKKGAATKNIEEMLDADVPENTRIIIETGGTKQWNGLKIPSDGLTRYEIRDHKLEELEVLGQGNMGEAETFADFLRYCTETYPAEEMSVILWDHGSGSVDGVCYDENYQMDSLTLHEMDQAFASVQSELEGKFGFVGFDACLMSNLDVAAVIEPYAEHMIASEELEPSGGWDYKTLIASLGAENFYDTVLDSYAAKCEDRGKTGYTLSVLDLTQFAKVRTQFLAYAGDVLAKEFDADMQGIVVHAEETMKFGYSSGTEGYSNLIDLVEFAEYDGNEALTEAVTDVVTTVNGPEKTGACGLSIYFPLDGESGLAVYARNSTLTEYSTLLASYFSEESSEAVHIQLADCGSDSEGELAVSLTEGSEEYVKKVVYRLYRFEPGDEEEYAYCMGYSTDLSEDGENGYCTSFGGEWFSLNGNFLSCTPIYQSGDVTGYSTPVLCDGEQGTLRFSYSSTTGTVHLEGFLPSCASDGSAQRLEDVLTYEEITIEYDDRTDSFTENLKQGETVRVADGVEITKQPFADGFFLTYIEITDIFGNQYHSDSVVLEMTDHKLKVYEIVGDLDYSKL